MGLVPATSPCNKLQGLVPSCVPTLISKLCVFNTYIGLFDRSLLHMSLNQVELALKNATSKSHTPVSMYQFDPI